MTDSGPIGGSPQASSPGQVLAVVVTFNPGPLLPRLCADLIEAGIAVLVVDNASVEGQEALEASDAAGADVLRLPDNRGVSGALNVGLARAGGAAWLLTFDQDSVIGPGFVQGLLESAPVRDPRAAVVAPRIVDAASGTVLQGGNHTQPVAARMVITSGALCRVAGLTSVNGFRDDLFIDHVDHDICLRLRRGGWQIWTTPDAVMKHSIGAMRASQVVPGLAVRNLHHSADRAYYKYRNYLLLVRSGTAGADPRWALRTGLALAWGPIKVLFFETDRRAKFAATGAGLLDGMRGRGGRRRPPRR